MAGGQEQTTIIDTERFRQPHNRIGMGGDTVHQATLPLARDSIIRQPQIDTVHMSCGLARAPLQPVFH